LIEKSTNRVDLPPSSNELGLSQALEESNLDEQSVNADKPPVTPPASGSHQLQTNSPDGKVVKKKKKKK